MSGSVHHADVPGYLAEFEYRFNSDTISPP
jgi:hypothetical protein